MSTVLRIALVAVSLGTAWYVMRKIRKAQMQIEDSIFWILFSVLLVVLALFPSLAHWAAGFIGVASPVNFVFLAIIFVLLIKIFLLSLKVSQLENKFQRFVQRYAIDRRDRPKQAEEPPRARGEEKAGVR